MKTLKIMKTLNVKNTLNLALIAGMIGFGIFLSSCSKEDISKNSHYTTFKATDAPLDDANVQAVFVTVSDVKVDGQSIEGFNKTTLELSALTEGKTANLGHLDLEASQFSTVEFVLDYEQDAQGNSPGCYVHLVGGTKDKIASTSESIIIEGKQQLSASQENNIVFDFDLRKLIKEESNDYEFVSATEMQSYIRITAEEKTSHIMGDVEGSNSSYTVVYLYEKGTFDLVAESKGKGESNVQFAKAVNSAVVKSTGEFTLSFIEDGNYEIHLISYEDSDNDGRLEVSGHALLTSTNQIDLGNISVSSDTDVELSIELGGWLPL